MSSLHIYSEIGKLKKVLLHEPGEELNNLTPNSLEELLFDDIPWLPLAKKEHQAFANAFKENGIEVVYLVDLASEVLKDKNVKKEFIETFLEDLGPTPNILKAHINTFLNSIKDEKELVKKCISGIKYKELYDSLKLEKKRLHDFVNNSIFATNPMPNLYFTRDPFAVINDGVSINAMYSKTRKRETIFAKFIFKYHKDYKDARIFYNRDDKYNIEGGDICVLSDKCLIVGVSQRTSALAIERLAESLFFNNKTNYESILAFHIPSERTFMHLDTIFSQVDYDKFTIHQACYEKMQVYELTKDKNSIKTKKLNKKLELVLEEKLGKKISLIPCGGNDTIDSDREQWSDGSNCICIAPGVVIAYERNDITNNLLKQYGIKVIEIPSSELSRGRGGPRCMSMPLVREDL